MKYWFEKEDDIVVIPASLSLEEYISGCSSLQRGGGKHRMQLINKWDVMAKYIELFGGDCPESYLVKYDDDIHEVE